MLASTLQVAQNLSVRIPFFRAVISGGNEAPQTGWAPSSVYVLKTGAAPYAKSLTSGVNFFEVDATNMQGLYEIVLDASDVDTLGSVTITDSAASSITIEVVESSNNLISAGVTAARLDLQGAQDALSTAQADLYASTGNNAFINKVLAGRWKVDSATKTLTIYEADGVTAALSLSLADSAGQATVTYPTQTSSSDPTLFTMTPSKGARWFADLTVTITGKNLPQGCTVSFGSTSGIVPSSTSSTSVTFSIPEVELYEVGAKSVSLSYASGQTNALTYTVVHPSSLYAGYRADTGIALNGANVSQWNDYSGNGRHLTQTTAARQPVYNASSSRFSNRPSVGPGVNVGVEYSSASPLPMPLTMFVVALQDATTGSYNLSVPIYGKTYPPEVGVFYCLDGSSVGTAGEPIAYSDKAVGKTGSFRKYKVPVPICVAFNGTSKVFRGTNVPTVDSGTIPNSMQGLVVAGSPSYAVRGAEVAEAMVFSSELTNIQVARLNRYAAYRYGTHVITRTRVADLPSGRGFSAAAQLGDGRIVVAGGQTSANAATRTIQIYSPSANTWESGPDIPSNVASSSKDIRDQFVRLPNGNAFLFTGEYNYGATFNGTSWTVTSNTVPVTHGGGCKVLLLSNGKVGIFGGTSAGTAISLFDPATNTFGASAATMTSRAYWGTAVLLDSGKVLLIAGDSTSKGCQLYDPVTDSVSTTGALIATHSRLFACKLASGKVVVVGSGTAAELYDPSAGTWSSTGSTYGNADTNWYGMKSARFGDGTPLIPGCGPGLVNVYAEREGVFHTVEPRSSEAYGATVANLSDGRVFICGGDPHNLVGVSGYGIAEAAIYEKVT